MSRTAVSNRFNENCVRFFSEALKIILAKKMPSDKILAGFLENFERVMMIDSSCWNLNSLLKDKLPGFGGKGGGAGCKLQLLYDYKSSSIQHIELTRSTKNDQTYAAETISKMINKNDLFIFDLGYWSFDNIQEVIEKEAYFLSRFFISCGIWLNSQGHYYEFDLEGYLSTYEGNSLTLDAYFKKGKKFIKTKLVAFRAPEEVINKRRMKIQASGRKWKKPINKKTLFYLGWTIYVTNTEEDMIPSRMFMRVYSTRWTLEIIFKNWKSILKINQTNVRKNACRVKCEIYAKLILALIVNHTYSKLNPALWKMKKRELSNWKVWSFYNERSQTLYDAIIKSLDQFCELILAYEKKIISHCMKGKQKGRKATMEGISEYNGESNPLVQDYIDLMGKGFEWIRA